MNQVWMLIYPDCSELDVATCAAVLQGACTLRTFSIDGAPVTTESGLHLVPDFKLKDMSIEDIRAVIIPGGDPDSLLNTGHLGHHLQLLREHGSWLTAIGTGPVVLARAGLLDEQRYTISMPARARKQMGCFEEGEFVDQDLVEGPKLLTAQAQAFVDFALKIAELMGVSVDEATRDFFMGKGFPLED